MKIGILTYQFSVNFGAQLQALALQEFLKNEGHEVYIIDYYPQKRKPLYRTVGLKNKNVIKTVRLLFFKYKYASVMRRKFTLFQAQYLNLTSQCNAKTIATIANQMNAIIVGSDQVWSPSARDLKTYFINWKPSYPGRRISYAPCCAKNNLDNSQRVALSPLMAKFSHLSVRNKDTQDFVRELRQIDAPIVLDPTFLYDFSIFDFASRPPYSQYILTYILGPEISGGHENMINGIKQQVGDYPVVSMVLSDNAMKFFHWSDRTYYSLSPIEWLSFIKNALFFYTDSFHGVAFALKFHIPFLAYYSEEMRSARFIDLQNRFGLENHIVTSVSEGLGVLKKTVNTDFTPIDEIINQQIITSKKFLRIALQS